MYFNHIHPLLQTSPTSTPTSLPPNTVFPKPTKSSLYSPTALGCGACPSVLTHLVSHR